MRKLVRKLIYSNHEKKQMLKLKNRATFSRTRRQRPATGPRHLSGRSREGLEFALRSDVERNTSNTELVIRFIPPTCFPDNGLGKLQ